MREQDRERKTRSEERAGCASKQKLSFARMGESAHDEQASFSADCGTEQRCSDIRAALSNRFEPRSDASISQGGADLLP